MKPRCLTQSLGLGLNSAFRFPCPIIHVVLVAPVQVPGATWVLNKWSWHHIEAPLLPQRSAPRHDTLETVRQSSRHQRKEKRGYCTEARQEDYKSWIQWHWGKRQNSGKTWRGGQFYWYGGKRQGWLWKSMLKVTRQDSQLQLADNCLVTAVDQGSFQVYRIHRCRHWRCWGTCLE